MTFVEEVKHLSEILFEPIEWTGDLNDDCVARWRGMLAHAEAMKKGEGEWWWFVVHREDEEDDIVHSVNDDIGGTHTGESARRLCEVFMRLAAVGRDG